MTPDRWSQVEGLFLQAVEIPAGERDKFLDHACNGDATLRQEVNSLLACDAPETPLANIDEVSFDDDPGVSRQIGSYRLVRLLGAGGMGSVHLAVRDDHFQKEVAVKILKRGMDTDAMLLRFRQERQILANLEHPFIARLLDGGSTEDGLPYFVLEYVDGLPITKYCEEKKLGVEDILRLFRIVCEAVQYAHQNLVVHRDLKPGNILITKEGIPKLLDFGIAKVIAPDRGGDLQTLTQAEGRLMTPAYASPEQILGQPISTAADIYALGAVLYELLTRQRAHQFESELPAEMERVICQADPEKPSAALRGNARQSRELAGDLDNIVLTAMRKDPQRRYASAFEFSEDIRRHLEGRPVTAREDTLLYRAGKFVRRNKLVVTTGILVVASLAGGMAATAYQARRAERRFQLVRQIANDVLFDLHDQVWRLPGSTAVQRSMIQTVVRYLDTLAQDSGGDPTLDLEIATAYSKVASVEGHPNYPNLGQSAASLDHYLKAVAILERLSTIPGISDRAVPALIVSHQEASGVASVLGNAESARFHLEKAAALTEEVLSRGRPELPPATLVSLYAQLATAASQRGDLDAEQAYGRKSVEVCEKWTAKERNSGSLETLRTSYLNLADSQSHAGNFQDARGNFEKALQVNEEMVQRPDATYRQRFSLASVHHLYGDLLGATDNPNLGDPEGALAHYQAATAISETLVASDVKDVSAQRNLSSSYRRVGLILLDKNPAEALKYYEKAVEIVSRIRALDAPNIQNNSALANSLLGVGTALHNLRRNQEALPQLKRTIELQESIETVNPELIWYLRTTSRAYLVTGDTLMATGDAFGALDTYQKGLAAAERILKRAPASLYHVLDRADLLDAIGKYYLRVAKRPEALSWFEKSRDIWQDWIKRNVAMQYAQRRDSQIRAILTADANAAER